MTHEANPIEAVFRQESGKILSSLVRVLRDFDQAEEALQDALAQALEQWPREGLPDRPGAWLSRVAKRRAIDRIRSERSRRDRELEIQDARNPGADLEERLRSMDSSIEDDRLRMIFTCCHPSLAVEVQVALTLNALGGLRGDEIARAFLVPASAMRQRLVRGKQKIKAAGIPYRVPPDALLPERVPPVLTVIYLIFNEGYSASRGESWLRQELSAEGIRLGRLLAQLMPDEPEVHGLLALMLLHDARRRARASIDGDPILLADQDRELWDRGLAAEGRELLERALLRGRPGSYQIQAAIAAVHHDARRPEDTDWAQIVALYDELLREHGSPVVALNRAVAIAMRDGPEAGLERLDRLAEGSELTNYLYLHSSRGELLRRIGSLGAAREAYRRALELAGSSAEMRFLEGRLRECSADDSPG